MSDGITILGRRGFNNNLNGQNINFDQELSRLGLNFVDFLNLANIYGGMGGANFIPQGGVGGAIGQNPQMNNQAQRRSPVDDLAGGAVNFRSLTGGGNASTPLGDIASFTPATGRQQRNGQDQGNVIGVGYNNAVLDKIMGTDLNGTIGGGNARRATNNGILDNGLLGARRFTNAERTDVQALSNYIDANGDPDQSMVLRDMRKEGNKNVYTGFLDGTPDGIAASIENGRVKGGTLANQGNGTRGQTHWTAYMGDMQAGEGGTVVSNHNTVLGETVPMTGGGFRTALVHDNGGDHNGVIAGFVSDRNAKSAAEARRRITIENDTNSVSDVGTKGQTQAGAQAAKAYSENKAAGKIPGAGAAAQQNGNAAGGAGGGKKQKADGGAAGAGNAAGGAGAGKAEGAAAGDHGH